MYFNFPRKFCAIIIESLTSTYSLSALLCFKYLRFLKRKEEKKERKKERKKEELITLTVCPHLVM